MLVAVTTERRRVVAGVGVQGVCPACAQELVVRLPRERVPHFAHRPHAGCTGEPRAKVHRRARRELAGEVDGQGFLFDLP